MAASDVYQVNLAAAALAFALFSFIVATVQALGQYFWTADGYRRCKASLVGHWARKVRLRWRWRQLRFESMFTTPDIFLSSYTYDEYQGIIPRETSDSVEWIAAPNMHRKFHRDKPTNTKSRTKKTKELDLNYHLPESQDLACWLYFLNSLRAVEVQRQSSGIYSSLNGTEFFGPACKLRERSWDLMSPELVRPLARTTVCDIAIMVRRLGMTWRTFQPEEGMMSAEGNGHLVYSTYVKSLGVILHYMSTGTDISASSNQFHPYNPASQPNSFIPTREVDMLSFGIVAGCKRLHIPDYPMSSIDDVYRTLNSLDPSCRASKMVRDVRGFESTCTFGFSDLIPLAAPMFRFRNSTHIHIPTPSEYCVGLTCHQEGFVVFYHRLKEHINIRRGRTPDLRVWVLQQYEELRASYAEWEDEVMAHMNGGSRSLDFLNKCHDLWEECTVYFERLQVSKHELRYVDLIAAHVKHVVRYWGAAWAHIRGDDGKKAHDHYGLRDWVAEGAHMYWEYLPDIVMDVQQKCSVDEDVVREAWIMMMFRAFCWWRCHYMMAGQDMTSYPPRLPSRYWDSKQPVFIG